MENHTGFKGGGGQEFDPDFDFRFSGGEMYPLQPLFSYTNNHDQLYQTAHVPLPSASHQQAQTSQDHVINSWIPTPSYSPDPNLGHNYSAAPQIINFSSSSSTPAEEYCFDDRNFRAPPAPTRTPIEAEYHRKAESKRRNEQAQLFVSLSKVVPGLTKLDRASILEHATDYLKALQQRVSILEQQCQTSNNPLPNQEQDDDNQEDTTIQETITARISKRSVLITICCKKNEKLLPRIPYEIEQLNLNVMDIRVMPFGGLFFHITILAEMDREFYGTVNEVVDHLKNVLLNSPERVMHINDQSPTLLAAAANQDNMVAGVNPFVFGQNK